MSPISRINRSNRDQWGLHTSAALRLDWLRGRVWLFSASPPLVIKRSRLAKAEFGFFFQAECSGGLYHKQIVGIGNWI
ncbi:hypothetical protein RRG08_030382 [Elysia crispata]|uniref:Uncharacterized protein n=1 Tax=Elysia crispata TaxID=231223 RepID=A0AAE0YGK5_9GAST|nr:hypothetical protein RRG08_030382 [Elysia crispata]